MRIPHAIRTDGLAPALGVLEAANPGDSRVLSLSAVLARLDRESPHWKAAVATTTPAIVKLNPTDLKEWLGMFEPVKDRLREPLHAILRDERRDETEGVNAMNYLVAYFSESPEEMVDLIQGRSSKEFAVVFPEVSQYEDRAIALLEQAISDESACRRLARPRKTSAPSEGEGRGRTLSATGHRGRVAAAGA